MTVTQMNNMKNCFIKATNEFNTFEAPVPAYYFRRSFNSDSAKKAKLSLAVCGFYQLYFNGRKLEKGFLTMDFGAKYRGYCSDMTRTVSIGPATDEMKLIYNTVLSAQLKALESMKGGMACRDADSLARDVIREAGFGSNFGHGLGHGVGMLIHEFPRLSPKASPTTVLTPGYVVTVEPGIYLEGKFGCRIEDMVYIDEDGSVKNFTKSPKELIELV